MNDCSLNRPEHLAEQLTQRPTYSLQGPATRLDLGSSSLLGVIPEQVHISRHP